MKLIAFAVIPFALLAGCSGGGAEAAGDDVPDATDLGLEATSTTGLIRGIVVDEAIRPLANATVLLTGDVPRTMSTGPDGAFGFDGLAAGTHFLKVSKVGYFESQQSADVVAGVANPDAVKVQLKRDVSFQAFFEAFVYEGFVECTTSVLVLCGAPNTLEPFACDLGACYGNVTNDRFTWYQSFTDNATMIQSELVWESTQAASPELYFEMELLHEDCTTDTTFINSTRGASPIFTQVHAEDIEDNGIGSCPIYYSIFAGDATGDAAGVPIGATVEQRFTMYMHAFHGYLPPAGWRFTADNAVPAPPA